ncbi:MAG: hypothetical protein WCJ67_11170 [Thermoleophilia bacterium]
MQRYYSTLSSRRGVAAVHRDEGSGEEAVLVGARSGGNCGDVLDAAVPFHRVAGAGRPRGIE